jgi:hypothetical protein
MKYLLRRWSCTLGEKTERRAFVLSGVDALQTGQFVVKRKTTKVSLNENNSTYSKKLETCPV